MITSRKRSTSRRPTTSAGPRSTSRRRTSSTSQRRTSSTARRRKPALTTTLGTALGTLIVTFLLDASWAVRIGLVVLVLVVGLGYVLWSHRAEITAGTTESAAGLGKDIAGTDETSQGAGGPPAT